MSRRHVLFVLFLYTLVAYADRQIIGLTLDPISEEFGLKDWQLGLLSGFAFAIFFAVASIPFSFLVTRYDRRKLLSFTLGFWSICTLVSGYTTSFVQLFIARTGVGLGEAGVQPTIQYIISDLYEAKERTKAFSVMAIGGIVGSGLALLVGGIATHFYGWRAAMIIAGVPGIVLAIYVYVALPRMHKMPFDFSISTSVGRGSWSYFNQVRETFFLIWQAKATRYIVIAHVLGMVATFSTLIWLPTFLVRTHDMPLSQVGVYMALVLIFGGALCTWLVGQIAGHLGLKNQYWIALCPALIMLGLKPIILFGYWTDNKTICLVLLGLMISFGVAKSGPGMAIFHSQIRKDLRPIASGILLFLIHLIGMPIGAVFVGIVSDFYASQPENGLRVGLMLVQAFGIASAMAMLAAAYALRGRTGPLTDIGVVPCQRPGAQLDKQAI